MAGGVGGGVGGGGGGCEKYETLNPLVGVLMCRSKGRTLLQTKHMTVHDDLIDPTPVLRSFLLRLLLKYRRVV